MVDDEKMILRLATEALKTHDGGYKVLTALNGKQAIQILNSSNVDLVLTDLKMPVMDGYELLSYMSRNHGNIPSIVMTGFGSPEIARQLKHKGVVHYIEKPFEINLLREKISDVFAADKGTLRGFTLANFLQAVEVEQKTITLRIRSKRKVGYLHLEDGELIDAETDSLQGEEAAIEILCWDDPEIDMQGIRRKKRTIDSSMMNILLEASRQKDERSESRAQDDLLDEAVALAEGHHFLDAQKKLAVFLKNNPRNPKAWLWYSRIIINLKTIEAAITNAAKIAPVDLEIDEEAKKIILAKRSLKQGQQVRRCPFCWTPINVKSIQCLYCRSHLFVHKNFFSAKRDAKRDALKNAIERYMKVVSTEKNVNAYYYLSIAHLNLENWEEALNLFHKTVKLAPAKTIIATQLKTLLNYMASKEAQFEKKPATVEKPVAVAPEADQGPAKKKILVVEDSSTTRKVISITLGQKGYDIVEARDGLEALGMLNDGKPDLILLDIILPKMDGYKILEIIKKNVEFKNIPVIMLTSRDSFMSKLKGKMSGSTAYLTKPFDPKKLVDTIEKFI